MKASKWEKFERVSKVIQLVMIILGATALFAIPYQIRQASLVAGKGTFDVLWQLDTRLRERTNDRIFLAIEHKKPIVTGKITEDDLDLYLSDLCSIEEACSRGIITDGDVYEWFSDYVIATYDNKEIKDYIAKLQIEDPDYYHSFIDLYSRVQKYAKEKDKHNATPGKTH